MSSFGIANIIRNGTPEAAVLVGSGVIPLKVLLQGAPTTFEALLDDWDGWMDRIEEALSDTKVVPVPECEVSFAAAGIERPAIYCAGANYRDHIAEMGAEVPDSAYHFISPPGTLNAHRSSVQRPTGVEKLDWEVEVAAVIGRTARGVPAAEALTYVAGYTVANDVSVRDDRMFHPIFGVDWMVAKNGEGLTPLGPAVVPARYLPDVGNLRLSLTVNGIMRQNSNTSELVVDLPRQIESLSSMVTLRPGDVILTGTPAGTAAAYGIYLADGDTMVASVEGIGELENTVAS